MAMELDDATAAALLRAQTLLLRAVETVEEGQRQHRRREAAIHWHLQRSLEPLEQLNGQLTALVQPMADPGQAAPRLEGELQALLLELHAAMRALSQLQQQLLEPSLPAPEGSEALPSDGQREALWQGQRLGQLEAEVRELRKQLFSRSLGLR